MKNLAFGIGDTLHNMICDCCIDELYDIGIEAVKAINQTIAIEYDDNTMSGEYMFVIDIMDDPNALHSIGIEFDTLEEAKAFLYGMKICGTYEEVKTSVLN